ncbi:MAG TPA: hypothetical protein VHQ86_06295 [Candidatus Saccharimonadia bacterium]|jgi:succinylglutamate desuccinylase|nr:hypothetical protein [Candidatus Saccharimonadia bacterium]
MTPLSDMLRGQPERITNATASPKILIVWQHANEQLAPRTAHHIYTERPDLAAHVDYICGNPRAAAHPEDLGFIETDLNRSYGAPHIPPSYEETRAAEILGLAAGYDYVLDLHASVDPEIGDFIVIAKETQDEPAVRDLIAAAPNRRVLIMPTAGQGSLIGTAQNAITIEYSVRLVESRGVSEMTRLLDTLVHGKGQSVERELYHIEGTIPKDQDPGPAARNFELWKPGGYYPILLGSGPRSYRQDPTKDYCCFYAKRKERVVL